MATYDQKQHETTVYPGTLGKNVTLFQQHVHDAAAEAKNALETIEQLRASLAAMVTEAKAYTWSHQYNAQYEERDRIISKMSEFEQTMTNHNELIEALMTEAMIGKALINQMMADEKDGVPLLKAELIELGYNKIVVDQLMSLRQIKALGHHKMVLHQQLMQLERQLPFRFTESETYDKLSPVAKRAQQLLDELDTQEQETSVKAIPTEPLAQITVMTPMPVMGYEDIYGRWHPLPLHQIMHQRDPDYEEVLNALDDLEVIEVPKDQLVTQERKVPEVQAPVYMDQPETRALLRDQAVRGSKPHLPARTCDCRSARVLRATRSERGVW
jgi:hypothetical protein